MKLNLSPIPAKLNKLHISLPKIYSGHSICSTVCYDNELQPSKHNNLSFNQNAKQDFHKHLQQ